MNFCLRPLPIFTLACMLTACGQSAPPPDLVKTQRQALEKARDVAKDALKQDQGARVQVDDASK
jgi:outer membrane PBP1 activator LpoA protein